LAPVRSPFSVRPGKSVARRDRVIHAVSRSDRGKESTVSRTVDDAPETPGAAPLMPGRRARPLTSPLVHPWQVGIEASHTEPGEEGPKRLTRHERVPDEGHQRGR
jgi:hypothetical protein